MTIVFLDDKGTLQNRYQQRQFTATLPLAYACVDYFDPARPNEKRPQEIVYRDGAFQFPYDVGSKKEGNLYTVVRQAGWSDSLHLRAEETAPAGAAGYFPVVYGQASGDMVSGSSGLYMALPASWGALLYIRATGAALGGGADFFGSRYPASGGSAYLGNYLMCDGAGGLRMGYTRNGAEDASPPWVPGPGDVGKLHAIVGTGEAPVGGALLKIYANGVQIAGSTAMSNPSLITPGAVRFGSSVTFPQLFPNIGFAGGWRSGTTFTGADCLAWCAKMRAAGSFQPPDGADIWTLYPPASATGPAPGMLSGSAGGIPGMGNTWLGASRAVLTLSDVAF
jgi:hypothetical protein